MADPRHRLGRDAEAAVAGWLAGAGWTLRARNWRGPVGSELDLVAIDPSGVLVGVEVRARRSERAGAAATSLDPRRVARMRLALAAYAAASGERVPRGLRLDLVTVEPELTEGRWRLVRLPDVG